MELYNLESMVKGWFVGAFDPVIWKSSDIEIAIKYYKAGDKESKHVHKIAKELTAVAQGSVKMNGQVLNRGEIVVLNAGESTDFEAIEDSITVVVKSPSVAGDKYLSE